MGFLDGNDDFFGGMFDLDGDGETSWAEVTSAFGSFCEAMEEDDSDSDYDSDTYYDLDSSDDDLWRESCEDGSDYSIYPNDYDSAEEYESALEDAKSWDDYKSDSWDNLENYETIGFENTCLEDQEDIFGISDHYGIYREDYESAEEFQSAIADAREWEKLSEEDNSCPEMPYFEIPLKFTLVWDNSEEDSSEDEQCDSDETLLEELDSMEDQIEKACIARYLSKDQFFLYSQAIKDHFALPCALPDEKEKQEIVPKKIFHKIAKRDSILSLEIWAWCLEYFLPYAKYDNFCTSALGASVLGELYTFPDGYMNKIVHYMNEHEDFCKNLAKAIENPAGYLPELIATALEERLFKPAQTLFEEGFKKSAGKWKPIVGLTEKTIYCCKNYKEKDSIEYFRDNMLPLVKAIPLDMVQDEIDDWESEIEEYIAELEERARIIENIEKQAALRKEREREREEKEREKRIAEQERLLECENDKNIYIYCGVMFPHSARPYVFRTDDETIKIGDFVIVPVGANNKETTGEVVSVGHYLRIAAPYPVEKTKSILRKTEKGVI